jgi:beta-galactosidase
MKIDFTKNWNTYPTPEPEEWHLPRTAREVRLPHDETIRFDTAQDNVSGPAGAYYPSCSVEYEKTLTLREDWQDKRISLLFDGVYHNAVVRVNNQLVTRACYGYNAFTCDLTPFLRKGDNLLRVSAANKDVPNSRWYTGTGIYREVFLLVQPKVYLPYGGVLLTTMLAADSAEVTARVCVRNETDQVARRQIQITLRGADGAEAAQGGTELAVGAGGDAEAVVRLTVRHARLWSPEEPALYDTEIALLDNGREEDLERLWYGLRTVAWNAAEGFLLNGRPIKLKGGCVHHDNGLLGAASYARAEERKIAALKASGFNAIRSTHNPASDALLRACDKIGMLVMDEAFDMWREPKMPYDNSLYFEATWRGDLAAMVRRDRNHACVAMYSTGNEIPERDGHSGGYQIAAELANELRRLDPTRPVLNALCAVAPQPNSADAVQQQESGADTFTTVTESFVLPLDIVGYNYMPSRFAKDRLLHPGRVFCASETAPSNVLNGWNQVEAFPCVIGDFVWTAIDYLGEVGVGRTLVDEPVMGLARYPYRLSGCGDLDICLRKKPRSHYRDCVWGIARRPFIAVESPAIYCKTQHTMMWGWPIVQEYWNYPGFEGKPAKVSVYSAAETVALYCNGQLIGRQAAGKCHAYTAEFTFPYEPGELTAVEETGGAEGARHTIRTPDAVRRLRLTPDKPDMAASEDDLVFVDVELTDGRGVTVLDETVTVYASADGGAGIAAAGNTAIHTTANYTDPCQQTYEGHLQVILRRNDKPEDHAVLTCVSQGLPAATLRIPIS